MLICEDNATTIKNRIDVTSIMVRTKVFSLIRNEIKVQVDKEVYKILVLEEVQGLEDIPLL